jgi:hypothetical protein
MLIPLSNAEKSRRRLWRRIGDFVLYLGIALLVVAAVVAAATMHLNEDRFMKMVGFAAATVALFYYFIAGSRPLWKKSSFWGLTGSLFIVHALVFAIIFAHIRWKPIWLGMVLPEILLFLFCRRLLFSSN